jgi:hypothetical protein
MRGSEPGAGDDDRERVKVHLAYVERLLRQRPAPHPTLEAARTRTLDHLADYHRRGIFPWNDDHSDRRRPTFIDDDGRLCAVGHLLAEDRGRPAAEAIATRDKYAYAWQIRDVALAEWIGASGLRAEELALIQPTYPTRSAVPQIPAFATLVPLGGQSQVFGAMSWPGADGTLTGQYRLRGARRLGGGPYFMVEQGGGTELGAHGVVEAAGYGRLVLRAGGLLPVDGVQQGLRLSASPIYVRGCSSEMASPAYCFVRLDAGLASSAGDWWAELGAGVGYRTPVGVYMVEYTQKGAQRAVAGTLRYVHHMEWHWLSRFRPGVSLVQPLDDRPRELRADLQVMLGPTPRYAVW